MAFSSLKPKSRPMIPKLAISGYWAKTTKDGRPGITVLQHCLIVGEIAKLLACRIKSEWARYIPIIAAMHDVGKICLGFQAKCEVWLQINKISPEDKEGCETDHAVISQWSMQQWLGDDGRGIHFWAVVIGAHHGWVKGDRIGKHRITDGGNGFALAREELRDYLIKHFGPLPTSGPETKDLGVPHPLMWAIAGLITIADWIGSDESFFPSDKTMDIDEIRERAKKAVEILQLLTDPIVDNVDFDKLFGFSPRNVQKVVDGMEVSPGSLIIVEAPMGCGKTEAALSIAHKMMMDGTANGFYFALPTQTTSNKICGRVDKFICDMGLSDKVRLMHANTWLHEDVRHVISRTSGDDGRTEEERDWFQSKKRAMLTPFGVGTVDQALMGVIAVKHFFLRQFALSGKVVILDEVHSYDLYTGTLIDLLIMTLRELGATVILLSATLSTGRRAELLGKTELSRDYPLVTVRNPDGLVRQLSPEEPKTVKSVVVKRETRRNSLRKAAQMASAGACVVWICNTVESAQRTFNDIRDMGKETGLLHSRFPHFIREKLESHWIDALGKSDARPNGCILVSTQVVEQSVDIDADLLITELAPTDMLLQRIGRLWRHDRIVRRPGCKHPEVIIVKPGEINNRNDDQTQAIKDSFGKSSYVYSPYVLVRTWKIWQGVNVLTLPDDIRRLIDDTYKAMDNEPESWTELKKEMDEKAKKLRCMAVTSTLVMCGRQSPDDDSVLTRYSDKATVAMLAVLEETDMGNGSCRLRLLSGKVVTVRDGVYDISVAREIHKNIVRLPHRGNTESVAPGYIQQYLPGQAMICILKGEELLSLPDRKKTSFTYTDQMGVMG
jgi:CRISPR-associated endonuclease/helicase Cas3